MKQKYIKTIVGEISKIDTELPYLEAIKLIPEEARIMKVWEFVRLAQEDRFKLTKTINNDWYFTYDTKEFSRACRLGKLGLDSDFVAFLHWVDLVSGLRGVLIVKKVKGE